MDTLLRRPNAYTSMLLGCVAVLSCTPAGAQEDQRGREAIALPGINVTNTRLVPGPRRVRSTRGTPAQGPASDGGESDGSSTTPTESSGVSAIGSGTSGSGIVSGTVLTGASTSIVTSADFERSPSQTLQDILAREPGIQVRS